MLPSFKAVKFVRKVNNPNDPFIQMVVGAIKEYLADNHPTVGIFGCNLCTDQEAMEFLTMRQRGDLPEGSVLYIAIGGDGTVLTAGREAVKHSDYLVGFNTGNLGFLAEFNPRKAVEVVADIFNDRDVFVERRAALKCFVNNETRFAMNDFVISDAESDKPITYALTIHGTDRDSHAGTHTANGVIISTPTGSTAYALNVGGAILTPDLDVLQVLPTAPMSITSRPLIIDGRNKLMVTVKPKASRNDTHWVTIKADGQKLGQFDMCNGAQFLIESCRDHVNMIHHNDWNFFDVLREKLHWNKPQF